MHTLGVLALLPHGKYFQVLDEFMPHDQTLTVLGPHMIPQLFSKDV